MTLLTSNNTPALHHTHEQVGERPMHNRLILAGLAATGGLLTTAFLQTAVAVADAGADAFTIGGLHLRPATGCRRRGLRPRRSAHHVSPAARARWRNGARAAARHSGFQRLHPTAAPNWGAFRATRPLTEPLRPDQCRVHRGECHPVDGGDASSLPALGSVYDVFNLGNGYENVYIATPEVPDAAPSPTR